MPHSEHNSRSVAARGAAVANPPLHARISLRNGLCASSLFRDAAQLGVFGSRRETFQRALVAAAKFRTNCVFPGYQVIEEIGRGGMGIIYRAREARGARIVALKCLLAADATCDALVARFRREAETLGNLNHRNIIPVYRIGETGDGLPFFAMKFAANGNLDQARDKYRVDIRGTVSLIRDVALAVQYAHEKGILHRDLKPSNILLDEYGGPLVSDFGLAKSIHPAIDRTRTINILGTTGYLAPEQARGPGITLTNAADIYSLGAVLFELLTGRTPFVGHDMLSVIRQTEEKPAPLLRSIAPHLGKDLETICARCLQINPSDRYESAKSLAEDLESWLGDRPITARPQRVSVNITRWISRHKALAAAITVAFVSMAVLFSSVLRLANRVAPRHTAPIRNITVLPFLNIETLDPDTAITLSIENSLTSAMSSNPEILGKVVPANERSTHFVSIAEIKKIGRLTNAPSVLTGSVRTIERKRRVSLQLFDGSTGELRSVKILEIDSSQGIKDEVPRMLLELGGEDFAPPFSRSRKDPGLVNTIARDNIVAGRELTFRYTAADIDRAIELFKKAIRITPGSTLAHAYLASAAAVRTHYITDWTYLELAKTEAMKAVELDPLSGDAHRALAGVYYQEGRFSKAVEEGIEAIEVAGLDEKSARFIGMAFQTLGRIDRSFGWLALASSLDGTPGDMDSLIGDCWVKLSDDEHALAAYNRSVELQPTSGLGGIGICRVHMLQGKFDTARHVYRTGGWNHDDLGDSKAIAAQIEFFSRNFITAEKLYSELASKDPDGGGAFYGAVSYESAVGRAKEALGDESAIDLLYRCLRKEEEMVKQQPENPEAFYRLAAVESTLRMSDQACRDLRSAVKLGWTDVRSMVADPRFDFVRANPDFLAIVNDLSAKLADMKAKTADINSRRNNQWQKKIGMN